MLEHDIRQGNVSFGMAEYSPLRDEEVPLGAGCWHPAFPAIGSDLQALVASAVPVIATFLGAPWRSRGRAMVMRRNEFSMELGGKDQSPLIEVCWNRSYR